MADERLSLPARRAFVVQLYAEAQVEQDHFRGRVEHLVSHQAARHDISITISTRGDLT